jgi:uncharacterized membrane protein
MKKQPSQVFNSPFAPPKYSMQKQSLTELSSENQGVIYHSYCHGAMTRLPYRFASVTDTSIHWRLPRNCSITPKQLCLLYASLCCVSLGIGFAFYVQGVALILPFALAELAAVGIAFFVYARHATDAEHIQILGQHLVVEIEEGGVLQRVQFPRYKVRVEPRAGRKALIEVSAHRQSVHIGRHVRPELRAELAQEIRRALRA